MNTRKHNGPEVLSGMRSMAKLCLVIFVLSSCTNLDTRNRERPLASVYEKNLYLSDIPDLFPSTISRQDSILILQNYIDKWIRKQLILQKAELNLTEEQKDVRQQIEEYRSSLLIFKYEQNLILQKLDTLILPEQIETYYNENSSNFMLDEIIVKALFIKLPSDAPELYRVRQLYRSEREEDIHQLESYCYQYADKYDYFNEDWIPFESITDELPDEIRNPESFLRYNRFIEQQDSAFAYYVKIREYLPVNSVSPPEYVEAQIRSIILNQRKVRFIKELENNIYIDALNKGNFTIY
jgi:hypothetical protein